MYRVAIDAGGTFTDLVVVDEEGNLYSEKVPSDPERSREVFSELIRLAANDVGLGIADFLRQCTLIHGTTGATNALVRHNGAKTGLITTKGHRDQLEFRLGIRDKSPYDFLTGPPPTLIPRYLRVGVRERILISGDIVSPLDEEDVRTAIHLFKKEGVESVAVCFLSSFANPAHERAVGEILRQEFPEAFISLSADVLPRIGIYSRVSTTAVDAYLKPGLNRYMDTIEELLRSLGLQGQFLYMQSNAGVATSELIKQRPVQLLQSGPSAGPTAGLFWSKLCGTENVITIDMGGTSFETCLVKQGTPDLVRDIDVQRYRIGISMVNVHTLGAGGGSIAWVDPSGLLQVGPQSAEAVPGPACYMKGGTEATVTDANVVLGYFNPDYLLGGRVKIDSRFSQNAIEEKIAKPLNISLLEAAEGIYRIINAKMIGGIRVISTARGYDPREFTIVAGGGCSSAHLARLASQLGIQSCIIPKIASQLCAFGGVIARPSVDYSAAFPCQLDMVDPDELNDRFGELEAQGYRDLKTAGITCHKEIQVVRSLEMRYVGQVHECEVTIPWLKITNENKGRIEEVFYRRYEELYTFCDRSAPTEIVNIVVKLSGSPPEVMVKGQPFQSADASKAKKGERLAFFEEYKGYVTTPIFDGDKLEAGNVIKGPAVVEETATTIVVPPAFELGLDGRGFYLLIRT